LFKREIEEALGMPEYDYKCKKCKKIYSIMMLISEHDTYRPKCPSCGSTSCEQQISSFGVKTEKLPNIQLPS
jgi:putative FmdB family regulatory protein